MAIVIFWPVYFSPLVVTWRKLYTIVCLGACDKLVSFLCVVFVSEEYSREYKKRIISCHQDYEEFTKELMRNHIALRELIDSCYTF